MASLRAGPLNTPTQLAKEHHYIFRQISAGTYAHVYFSIPKLVANQVLSEFDSNTITLIETCARLREGLQAIKVTKGKLSNIADNMNLEIAVLSRIAKSGHSNIVSLHEADTAEIKKSWYTLELLTGNTFGKYSDSLASIRRGQNDSPESLAPVAFGWHVILQLTEALLALHFGDEDGKECKSWPMYTHNDTHINNMLFRSGPGDFGNYPDVVLIDFGRAQKLEGQRSRGAFFEAQRTDVKFAISMVVYHGFRSSEALQDVCDEIQDLDIQKGADNNQVLKSWMKDLRNRAFRERECLYVALHPEVVEHFQQQETLSDVELSSNRSPSEMLSKMMRRSLLPAQPLLRVETDLEPSMTLLKLMGEKLHNADTAPTTLNRSLIFLIPHDGNAMPLKYVRIWSRSRLSRVRVGTAIIRVQR